MINFRNCVDGKSILNTKTRSFFTYWLIQPDKSQKVYRRCSRLGPRSFCNVSMISKYRSFFFFGKSYACKLRNFFSWWLSLYKLITVDHYSVPALLFFVVMNSWSCGPSSFHWRWDPCYLSRCPLAWADIAKLYCRSYGFQASVFCLSRLCVQIVRIYILRPIYRIIRVHNRYEKWLKQDRVIDWCECLSSFVPRTKVRRIVCPQSSIDTADKVRD